MGGGEWARVARGGCMSQAARLRTGCSVLREIMRDGMCAFWYVSLWRTHIAPCRRLMRKVWYIFDRNMGNL